MIDGAWARAMVNLLGAGRGAIGAIDAGRPGVEGVEGEHEIFESFVAELFDAGAGFVDDETGEGGELLVVDGIEQVNEKRRGFLHLLMTQGDGAFFDGLDILGV